MSRELLTKGKLEGMRKEANNHQTQMDTLVQKLSQSDGLDSGNIQNIAQDSTDISLFANEMKYLSEKGFRILPMVGLGYNRDNHVLFFYAAHYLLYPVFHHFTFLSHLE